MKKSTQRVILISLISVVSLILVLFFAVLLLINPNDYRDKISSIASKKLKHEVQLNGPISVHYFPWLGLTAKDVKVISSFGINDTPLASIDKLSFKVDTLALLKREVKVDKILIHNASVYLERNGAGLTNWAPVETSETKKAEKESSSSDSTSGFVISGLDISDSDIVYDDQRGKKKLSFKDFNLKTGTIESDKQTSIKGDFNLKALVDQNSIDNTSRFNGTIDLNTRHFVMQEVDLDITVLSKSLGSKPFQASLSGEMEGDMLHSLISIKNMKLKAERSNATGSAAFSWQNGPKLTFDLNIDQINADSYLALLSSTKSTALASSKFSESNIRPVSYTPPSGTSSFSYAGKVSLGKLRAKGLDLSQVKFTAQSQSSGVLLNPLSAQLYRGTFNGQSLINTKAQSTSIKGHLGGIQVESLLNALMKESKIVGTGHADLDLVMTKGGLNGFAQMNVQNGFIKGLDLEYYMELAGTMLNKQPKPTNNRNKTPFKIISGSFNANNNLLTNRDLRLEADNVIATGAGTIDLNRKFIDYRFVANRVYHDGQAHPNALPLAVRVTGPFDHVKITPDIDTYIQAFVAREAKKQIGKQIDKQLGKILGVPNNEAAPSGAANPLEDTINKGINKLFKF